MKRYALRSGESLAIKPGAIERDGAGMFLMIGDSVPENERRGTVCVVHIRGPLTHFEGDGGDSYEGIVKRTQDGLDCDPRPSAVLFRIESPGGLVAGCWEAVAKLQAMSKSSGVPFVAYIDEMAASAAFAVACSCGEILAPRSAVAGSIGTISTMVSAAGADEQMGLEFRLITSGKRKADGHPHAALTDEAEDAERGRTEELAAQFFALVGKARGISPKKIQALEAAIFLASDAERIGLIDGIASLDEVLYGLDETEATQVPLDKSARAGTSLTHSGTSARAGTPSEAHMAVKLDALIKRTEAAIATEADPKNVAALHAKLAAFTSTRAEMDDGKAGDDVEDGEDASKAEKAKAAAEKAARKAEGAKHRAKAAEHKAKAAESEEAAKKAEAEDGDEEAAAGAVDRSATTTGLTPGQLAAIESQRAELGGALGRIAKLEKETEGRARVALIEEARAQRRITPGEAVTLAKKETGFIRDFLEMRPKALVNTDDDALLVPSGAPAGDIPASTKKLVEAAINAAGLDGEKADKFREESYKDHRAAQAQANGAGVTH
jgi:ClpP class serine protease